MNRRTERSVNAENEDDGDEEHYGVTDYRSTKPWMFAARLLLKPRKRAKMSIGVSSTSCKQISYPRNARLVTAFSILASVSACFAT